MPPADEEWRKYEHTKEQFIHIVAKNMNLYGITPSVGRLYGALYFSDDSMTLDDMRDALGMSKTSMSTGVRQLMDLKMVEPVFKRGVRKDLYASEEDWYKSFTALFSIKWKKSVQKNLEELREARHSLQELGVQTEDKGLQEHISKDIVRLDYAYEYYEWLLRLIDTMESGEIFDFVPKRHEHNDDVNG
ncbi:GbsR/MarR family transcriptional regulator [Aureibacillus halotolerans]|uniref:HTH-type transcriptional regulator n=1 Tax=Aureibacillus halotolerans TaxID=1508390 RepID=A0A4R6TUQ4_9BACI|nr:GbsR/MarR family transcriptional regulator [Aureibacillus halotolerans]TDQ35394.1 DNA-binding transcriptional regulator GbsR (MarR family) [Aureibacillus halotolerans]